MPPTPPALRPALSSPTVSAADPRVLVLYCHPNPHRSRINQALRSSAQRLSGVTIHDLYEAYPDHGIDVPREQALLAAHPTVVMQHPFYWYSVPPLLKSWMDLVLTWGWAYGHGGTALRGKRLLTAVTTGGAAASYQRDGFNRFTIPELLAPIAQTAHLCGMTYLEPFVVHGTHRAGEEEIARAAAAYRERLLALAGDGPAPLAVGEVP